MNKIISSSSIQKYMRFNRDSEKKLPKKTVIQMWLDTYDEMFSDFDPRPYLKRALSDDFISQVKKVTKDQYGMKIILKLLLLEENRNRNDEKMIAERLHLYFVRKFEQLMKEKKKTNLKGALMTTFGITLMLTASHISLQKPETFPIHLLLTIFEPAGWFLLWVGLDDLVYSPRKTKKEFDFFSKMAIAEIQFGAYS